MVSPRGVLQFGRWSAGGVVLAAHMLALSGCGKEPRPPNADLNRCTGARCQGALDGDGGADGQAGGEPVLELECELSPEVSALREGLLAPVDAAETPATCDEAVASRSYVGCDFWPTVTANVVGHLFDFAVVVASVDDTPAEVVVTRDGAEVARATVDGGSVAKIYLPWVDELKHYVHECLISSDIGVDAPTSRKVEHGAYHLTSDRPVVVYQFNPLQFQAKGGAKGKEWGQCTDPSYSNDASLLLPTHAMGTSYYGTTLLRKEGQLSQPLLAITATSDETRLSVYAPPADQISAGVGVPRIPAGKKHEFTLDAGDVIQLFSQTLTLSGTLIESDKPVQVISGDTCANVPTGVVACDHLEETLSPATALGRRYLLAAPTGPTGRALKYALQLHAHQDDTKLYYVGARPSNAPSTLDAGESVFLSNVSQGFELLASHEISVLLFLQGGGMAENAATDPSQSIAIPVEQFRRRYAFLAPSDYTANYADVVAPLSAELTLDGKPVLRRREAFHCSPYTMVRIPLDDSNGGIHLLEASEPVGVQVLGHAPYASYQYPGGRNVADIAPAPVRPRVE
jgi:hypothetical protein